MQTAEFERALDELVKLASGGRIVAFMCAEAVPWQCHRSLIADALTARGVPVSHIMSATKVSPHKMTAFAKVDAAKVSYPGLF
jgi:uncharacterized protein (DUF488 family)